MGNLQNSYSTVFFFFHSPISQSFYNHEAELSMHCIRLWKLSYTCQGNAIAMQKGTSFPLFFAASFKKLAIRPVLLGMKRSCLSFPSQNHCRALLPGQTQGRYCNWSSCAGSSAGEQSRTAKPFPSLGNDTLTFAYYKTIHALVQGSVAKWLRNEQDHAEAIDLSFGLDKMVNKCRYSLNLSSSRELCSSWTLLGLCGNTAINARLCTHGHSWTHFCFSK